MSQPENKAESQERFIYYVWDYLEWGGGFIYFLGLMQQAGSDWSVRAVMPVKSADRLFGDLKKNEIDAVTFPAHTDLGTAPTLRRRLERRFNKIRSELIMLRELNRLNLKDGIIHLDMSPWHSFLAVLYLALRSRVVQTMHTPLTPLSPVRKLQWQMKMGLLSRLKSYRLLASNESVKESYREFVTAGVFERIEIAYSGINRREIEEILKSKPERAETARQFKIPGENLWVVTIGQFIERKGCWTLLEAAQKIKAQEPGVTFLWLGTIEPDAQTKRQIENYNLGDTFKLLSYADFGAARQDLLSLAAQADVFVLPSFLEGLPMALCEAMSLKLACVASNVGAIPEAIEDGHTGLLIEAGNSETLAAAILKLKQDERLRLKIAQAGQTKVFAKFDDTATAQITLRAYEEIWRK